MDSVTKPKVISDVDSSELLPLFRLQGVVLEQKFGVSVALGQRDTHRKWRAFQLVEEIVMLYSRYSPENKINRKL